MTNNVERAIGRLEGKVDSLIEDIKILRKITIHDIAELEDRVAKLEKKQYTIITIATVLWTGAIVLARKLNIFG